MEDVLELEVGMLNKLRKNILRSGLSGCLWSSPLLRGICLERSVSLDLS